MIFVKGPRHLCHRLVLDLRGKMLKNLNKGTRKVAKFLSIQAKNFKAFLDAFLWFMGNRSFYSQTKNVWAQQTAGPRLGIEIPESASWQAVNFRSASTVCGSDRQMPNEKLARDLVLQHMDWTKPPDEFDQ